MTQTIQSQLWQVIEQLNLEQQQEVLNFARSLSQDSLFQKWDNISDEEAEALKAEFTEEDLTFAEDRMKDYLSNLQQEDKL